MTQRATPPTLAELRDQLRAAEEAYPELRRQLRQARAGVERRLGLHQPTATQQRNQARIEVKEP